MVTNRKVTGKAGSIPKGVAIGTAVALLLTLLVAFGMTQLVLTEKMSENGIGYGAMITLPFVSGISSWIAVGIIRRRRMQVCLLSAASYFIVLCAINILFFGGQFGGLWLSMLLIFAGAFGVGVLGLRGDKGGRKKHKSYHPR